MCKRNTYWDWWSAVTTDLFPHQLTAIYFNFIIRFLDLWSLMVYECLCEWEAFVKRNNAEKVLFKYSQFTIYDRWGSLVCFESLWWGHYVVSAYWPRLTSRTATATSRTGTAVVSVWICIRYGSLIWKNSTIFRCGIVAFFTVNRFVIRPNNCRPLNSAYETRRWPEVPG